MRICIYGAGAIGGYLAVQLALAGENVKLIARGPHLKAIQRDGLKLLIRGEERRICLPSTDNPAEVGVQDYVIVTLKAPSVLKVVDAMQSLFDPQTAVVWGINGIPWWYFYRMDGRWANYQLASIDPGGLQWSEIDPRRIIGCVIYPACELIAPGVIRHVEGNRLTLGEPSGDKTERVKRLSKSLIKAGFKAPVREQIRDEIWLKLWGNLAFNSISTLTHATLDAICADAGTRRLARTMMLEAQAVGEKFGVRFAVDVDHRIEGASAVGSHKTSMLQDLERKRPMEIDVLLNVVQEMGRMVAVDTPTINMILSLIQQRARTAGVY